MVKINIAIDGPSGSGKSTIGKSLAQQLGYRFLDSGLLYRHFARFYFQKQAGGINPPLLKEWQKLTLDQEKLMVELEKDKAELSSPELSRLTSQVSPHPELRQIIRQLQQKLTQNKGWVVVGRDITSQILPTAEIKIFLTASLDARTQRRYQETTSKTTWNKVATELEQRDQCDQTRSLAPLQKTADSWELDTTNLSLVESVEKILAYIAAKTNLLYKN
ncbi:MAG: (d)CMP kinase [Candidatus Moeniiplasma glomeromycotorum]|nr:(d)CMP kinase [Candidatus Moeniiplasma glomeromycotorum]MCE8167733.1 (d)CMP kinase [Candidatus Moeniiplasma glomeromycotorum]MCE8169133.1 (d)CMP kinase [Candidatus Moeniiplasma glomeromycotorum]